MKIDVTALGRRLTQLRELRGLSLSATADTAQLAKSYLAKLERGEVENPGLKTLDSLARSLGVTLADLLYEGATSRGGHSDVAGYEELLSSIPLELHEFLTEREASGDRLPADVVRSLASIQFRGKRPQTVGDWRFIYEALIRTM